MGVWNKIDGDRLELGGAPPAAPGPGGWTLTRHPDGIAWLLLDQPGQSTNRIDQSMLMTLDNLIGELERDPPKGLVLRSAKRSSFMVGADISQFRGATDPGAFAEGLGRMHVVFDRFEALPFPTICVIHGHCLGGGLELALTCKYRIAVSNAQLGFPEVTLGVHPGLGGTARSVRLVDPMAAMGIMLTGKTLRAPQAKRMGLVDAVVEERHVAGAVRAGVEGKLRRKPISRPTAVIPPPVLAIVLEQQARRAARPEHYPAPFALIDLFRRHGSNFKAMKSAEVVSFAKLLATPQAQNMVRLFFLRDALKGSAKGGPKTRRLHVVGAGAMGGDIAAWCAQSGLTVSLADMSTKALGDAMKRANKLFDRRHLTGRLKREAADRLIPDPKGEGAATADLVIEAVPEKLPLKQKVYAELEAVMKPSAILGTNTSSLRLEELRTSLARPGRLVGIHFFNPVAQMQLVEVVRHDQEDADALAGAMSFVTGIGRLPASVGSAPGFLVNRALMPYLLEALLMADEGAQHEAIDQAATRFGMPMGPIELADYVGLDICLDVAEVLRKGLDIAMPDTPQWLADKVAKGELGKKTNKGLYDYAKGKPVKKPVGKPLGDEAVDRLILPMVNTCVACLREGVVADEDTVDGAMVFGTGFAPFRGGPLRYARQRGVADVTAALERLAVRNGPRFTPDEGWKALKP